MEYFFGRQFPSGFAAGYHALTITFASVARAQTPSAAPVAGLGVFYENSFCTNLFCLPTKPEYDKSSPMYNGTCLMSNLPMKLRPEFIGDLDIITINVDNEQSHFKSKAYNYYKEDINSPEVQKVIEQMIESIECFSK